MSQTLEEYKQTLIARVTNGSMSAEDAFDAYEEAWLKDRGEMSNEVPQANMEGAGKANARWQANEKRSGC